MPESAKLRRLQAIRDKLAAGKLSEEELKAAVIRDIDGTDVRLSDFEALAVLDRRIAQESAGG